MTIEEAKIFLLQLHTDKQLNKSEHEALRLAIKALEREPCEDKRLYIKVFADLEPDDIAEKIYQICDEDKFPKVIESLKEYFDYEPCEDCVSREQLIKLYNEYRPYLATRVCEFGEKLKELPSVKLAKDNNVLTCEDAISRQAAIDCLNADFTIDGKENMETVVDYITGAFKQIKALPSVTPQPKMGKWINKYAEDACGERYSYWACSECGRDVGFNLANIEDVLSDYPYCHCGAKMVESQESEDKE